MFTRQRIFTVLAALIVLLGFAFGPAGATPAAAADTTRTHVIRASHSALVLDVEGGSTADGARIIQWNLTYGTNQQWVFDAVPGTSDTYYIRSVLSSKVLSVNSYVAGAPVIQWTNQGAATQQWVEVQINGISKFRNVATGLYLDVNGFSYSPGARLVQWYQTNGLNQQFQVVY
jgi:alpha-L-fucosidase 2